MLIPIINIVLHQANTKLVSEVSKMVYKAIKALYKALNNAKVSN